MRLLAEITKLRTLLVTLAIVGLAYLVVVQPWATQFVADATTKLWAKVVFLVPLCWIGALFVMRFAVYRMMGSVEYRVADVPVPPPPRVAQRGRTLMHLGLTPFGEYEERYPWQPWQPGWVFIDRTRSVLGFVSISSGSIATMWPDGSFVQTSSRSVPLVRHAPTDTLVWVEPWRSAEYARGQHVRAVARREASQGEPLRPTSMTELIARRPLSVAANKDALRATLVRSPEIILEATIFIALVVLEIAW